MIHSPNPNADILKSEFLMDKYNQFIHFVYPNSDTLEFKFIGLGKYLASEYQPDGYKIPSKIYNKEIVEAAAKILAHESFSTNKFIYEKSNQRYLGWSKNLSYLLALINRYRKVKLKIETDIWCTGSIDIISNAPVLKDVIPCGFDIKLRQGFLSDENQDKLFIVPENNFLPAHQEICDQKNVRVLSIKQFGELSPEYCFEEKNVLKVRSDELFKLISLVFELGPNPYKGLKYFDEEDSHMFFGREDVTQKIWNMYQNITVYPKRLISIIGPSGSGKSSIVRAGLIPKIRHSSTDSIILLTPDKQPLLSLAEGILNLNVFDKLEDVRKVELKETILERLRHGNLSEFAETLLEKKIIAFPLLIIFDQFEEIYYMCEDEKERTLFIRNLLYAASDTSGHTRLVVVFRADFLGHVQSDPELSDAIAQNAIIVPAMSRNNLRAAIVKPAQQSGFVFDIEIVDQLISQTEKHVGALPLFQFALARIWQGIEKGIHPEKTLEDIKGVGGALSGKAQELYDSLSEHEKQIARRIFLRLINIGEGIFDSRRRVLLSDIMLINSSIEIRKVLDTFSNSRIITISEKTIEITHETLFEYWNLLKEWIARYREDIRLHQRLSESVKNWKDNGRPDGLLWRDPDLDLLKDFYKRNSEDMTSLEKEFYDESLYKQIVSKRLSKIIFTALIILTILSLWGDFRARDQAEKMKHQTEITTKAIRKMTETFIEKFSNSRRFLSDIMKLNADLLEEIYKLNLNDPNVQHEKASNLNQLGYYYELLGETQRALQCYEESYKILKRLAEDDPKNVQLQKDLAVVNIEFGDIHLKTGKVDKAIICYSHSLEIRKGLNKKESDNKELQRDMAVSHDRCGDAYFQLGDTVSAIKEHEQAYKLRQRLMYNNPEDTDIQMCLSISYEKLGDIYFELSDMDKAFEKYQSAYNIRKNSAIRTPQRQKNLSAILGRIGNVYFYIGNSNAAFKAYKDSYDINEKISKDDPDNILFIKDLSISLRRLGDLYLKRGDNDMALNRYQEALSICRMLTDKDTNNTEWQMNLSLIHSKVGYLYLNIDNMEMALISYRKALDIDKKLADENPKNIRIQKNLSVSYTMWGNLYLKSGNTEDALNAYQQALGILKKLAEDHPNNMKIQEDLAELEQNLLGN